MFYIILQIDLTKSTQICPKNNCLSKIASDNWLHIPVESLPENLPEILTEIIKTNILIASKSKTSSILIYLNVNLHI